MSRTSPRARQGFTLLEVVLAVALTAIIGTLIASAIDFHLRQLTVQRTRIEEAQVARAVLRRIADDLRSVAVYRPPEASAPNDTEDALAGSGDFATGDGESSDFGGTSGESDIEGTSEASSSAVILTTPGLFGDQFTLQADVARVPRHEEFSYVSELNDPGLMGALSDVQTVTYFMSDDSTSSGSLSANTSAGSLGDVSQTGLARRIANRAATRFAIENGISDLVDADVQLLAPEVAAIEFAYFDGIEWALEWDSELRGGLPLAVEITLIVMPADQAGERASSVETNGAFDEVDADSVYRMVVHLPGSDPEQLAAAEEEALTAEMGSGL